MEFLSKLKVLTCLLNCLFFLIFSVTLNRPVERHPNFHLFCCMNPSTDINKRSLPQSLRTRYTELYVDEMTEDSELRVLISSYLPDEAHPFINGIIKLRRGEGEREERRKQCNELLIF